jgi:hypothetical protein
MGHDRLEAQFQRIAEAVEQQQAAHVVAEALTAAHASCVEAAAEEPHAEVRTLLTNVQTALETWQTVWPRLGAQKEFRQAVAREAHLWARKFGALAHDR